MAVAIRLKRLGTKKTPHFRICVIDSHRARDGKPIEELGYYDPSKNPPFVKLNKERAKHWVGVGAIPSVTVKAILKKEDVIA
ncbi:MAG: 30S ribosomal protein S16 [Candidatus Omnitrophota bacterium]